MPGTSHSDAGGNKSEDNLGGQQMWIIKTDGSGALQWDKTIFTSGYDDELGYAIETTDGCYIMANRSDADSGGYKSQDNWGTVEDFWFAKFCVAALPQSNFASSDSFVCEKFCVSYFDASANNPVAWQWLFPGGIPSSSSDENPADICYNNPGTYDVILITQNAYGADTLNFSNFITVYPTPPIPLILQAGNTLTSSSAGAYQWQLNGTDIPGATNQSYTVGQTGTYTIIIADSNGCINASSIYVEVTGIVELFPEEELLIYPNPSGGRFTVEWVNHEMKNEVMIRLMNVFGKVVFSSIEKISSLKWMKEFEPSVAPGIYFFEITYGERIFAGRKIVIGL